MSEQHGFSLGARGPQAYEEYLVPTWMGPWTDALLTTAGLKPGDRVLDAACGTGIVARRALGLVGPTGSVVGLDPNTSMLEVARAAVAAESLAVEWIEADITAIGMPEASVDVALSQQGFQYFPNKTAALVEIGRVLVSGGRLFMSVWQGHSPYTTAFSNALGEHISEQVGAQQRVQRNVPSREELEAALSEAGFEDVGTDIQRRTVVTPLPNQFVPQHLSAMPVADAFHALGDTSKQDLVSQVAEELAEYVDGQSMSYPEVVNVVYGTKA